LPIRTFPHCWAVIPAQCKFCPQCGEEIQIDNEGMDTQDNVELYKVGEFKMTTDYQSNQYGKMKPDDANNVEDLYKIAKARGYKPGWAYMQAKRLGMLG